MKQEKKKIERDLLKRRIIFQMQKMDRKKNIRKWQKSAKKKQ